MVVLSRSWSYGPCMSQLISEATQDIESKNLPVPKMYVKQRRTVDEFVAEYGSQSDIKAFETRYHTKINWPGQAAVKSGSGSTDRFASPRPTR